QNLPRRSPNAAAHYRTFSLPEAAETAPAKAADLQTPGPVAEILLGQRLPPPTVTAIGLKIFLAPSNPSKAKETKKKDANPFSGVRRMELVEKVLVHLWVEARQELLGGTAPAQPNATAPRPAPPGDPPAAAAAVAGGLFHSAQIVRQLDRSLLQVDTLGRLIYDAEKNTLRFDVLPDGNPDLPNDVQARRVPPIGTGLQQLFSQFLELEFAGSPTGSTTPSASKAPPSRTGGSSFKRLRAWVEMPGRVVTINSEPDRLEAYGEVLLHDKETRTTTLQGGPLFAKRANEPRDD